MTKRTLTPSEVDALVAEHRALRPGERMPADQLERIVDAIIAAAPREGTLGVDPETGQVRLDLPKSGGDDGNLH